MKSRFWNGICTVTIAGLTLADLARAQDVGCRESSLKGYYGFTVAGQILNADGTIATRNGVAMTFFDGAGNLTQQDYVMSLTPGRTPPGGIDNSPAFRTGETGTYKLNTDCTGTAEIDFPAPPGGSSGAVIKLVFVLSNHGDAIHTVVSSIKPPGAPGPVPAVIHSDGWKLGSVVWLADESQADSVPAQHSGQ